MKKIISVMLIFLCIALINIRPKAVSAASYTVIEKTSGRILYESNGDKRMPMASTTKVMTGILVIENLPLDKLYEIPNEAVGIEGSSIYLKKGEKLSGYDLLYGLMLASGNDAAYALAILTSGNTESFIALMNEKAKELNLKNTHFEDPCGLKSENHYTTSNDLARLSAYAMKNELFQKVVATKTYKIGEGENTRYLYNKNRILGELEGGDGIKTGYTQKAGRCLCSSATRNGAQVICVVLNDYSWFNDSKTLINKAFKEYSFVQISKKDEIVSSANIFCENLEKCDIITKEDIFYPLKKGEMLRARYEILFEKNGSVLKGESAGRIDFYLNGENVISAPCVFNEDIGGKQ